MKVNAFDLFLRQKRFDLIFKYIYLKNRDKKTQKTYWKWQDRKNNKIKDAYHKISHGLVQAYDFVIPDILHMELLPKADR